MAKPYHVSPKASDPPQMDITVEKRFVHIQFIRSQPQNIIIHFPTLPQLFPVSYRGAGKYHALVIITLRGGSKARGLSEIKIVRMSKLYDPNHAWQIKI
jgi:hypothetical protein